MNRQVKQRAAAVVVSAAAVSALAGAAFGQALPGGLQYELRRASPLGPQYDALRTNAALIARQATINCMTQTGLLVGTQVRYSSAAVDDARGRDTWPFDGTTTRRVGLLGPLYEVPTFTPVRRESVIVTMNAGGQVAGFSVRNPLSFPSLSQSQGGFFFDPMTGATSELVFSVGASNRAITRPRILTDNGWVIGSYTRFQTTSATNGTSRAFLWSLASGLIDLGEIAAAGVPAESWARLGEVVSAGGSGPFGLPTFIAGFGLASNEDPQSSLVGNTVFQLVLVPTPSAGVLGLAAGPLAVRRRPES